MLNETGGYIVQNSVDLFGEDSLGVVSHSFL